MGFSPARGTDDAPPLADLTLEELMDLELDAMSLIGIHHTHDKGEWMVGYSFMFMNMEGNRDGRARLSTDDVLKDFMVTPTAMDMEMHMLHFMTAPSDAWTLMVMAPYLRLSMDHLTRMGQRFTTKSEGFGDLSVTSLYSMVRRNDRNLILNAGLSLPTGSIDERDDTPAGNARLPYPMQLGSGTYDVLLGLTYLDQRESWAWGVHGLGTVRTGRNSNEYRLGNRLESTVWAARKFTDWFSSSVRIDGRAWGNIHGEDPQLNPSMVPTADTDRRAGERLDLLLGVNLFALGGRLEGHRIALEGGVPIYQNLDGPQLETDWLLSVSWQWTFGP